MIRPCKRCNKDISDHIYRQNEDWSCPRRDMGQLYIEWYDPMDNLEFLEYCYERSL